MKPKFFLLIVFFAIVFIFFSPALFSQSKVSLSIDTKNAGEEISSDFIGLSFEMERLLPDKNGNYFFSKNNKALLATFKTLGIKSLRVGGNTADKPGVKVPTQIDIDNLFAFAKGANVKVIYTLRLREGNPEQAAQIVKYIIDRYSQLLDCFAIGNEPNVFAKEYVAYREEWEKYVELIIEKSPNAKFCGPSSTPGKVEWANSFAYDFGKSGLIKFISQHAYPGGNGSKVMDQSAARSAMLSKSWIESYEKFYHAFVPAVKTSGLKFRIGETNNFYNGGAVNVSNTFASALWGLDYLYWWAFRGAGGINFHTGDSVAAGENMNPCMYASFVTSGKGYFVRPLGYAIKTFDLGSHGKIISIKIPEVNDDLNLSAYAVLSNGNSLYVTLINKENGANAKNAEVTMKINMNIKNAVAIYLNNEEKNIAATTGVTLGNSRIENNSAWNGKWSELKLKNKINEISLNVPVSSAVVVKLNIK